MSSILSFNNISKTYGDDTLFADLSIDFKLNEQLGLIGMNGSGKSTLLQLIAGITEPDEGQIVNKTGLRSVYLPQEDNLDPSRTVEEILYDSINDEFSDEKQRHKIVQKALGKGGFRDPEIVSEKLSGGWKKRLAITRALCCKPDILLLDEPTNHLDIDGILWLEERLKTARFSFIVVSHDRAFLENICLNVMEIGKFYPSGFFKIKGKYSKFDKEKKKLLRAQQKQQVALSSKVRREEEWLRQGPKARTTKARYRVEQAYNLKVQLNILRQKNSETAAVDIDFHATGRQTKKLLKAFHIKKISGGKTLFSDISFELGPKFCLGVAGGNGSGKSTFLSILEKKVKPDEGRIQWAENLKIAVFDQNRSRLNPEATLKQALNPAGTDSVNYKGSNVHVVTWAKRFLFMPDQLDMPVKKLSGGEKARIMLANIMLSPCDILLLDEPTNDLDILSLEVLEESIKQFAGAVVIVSHDRFLMESVCHKILYLDPEKKAEFFRNFDQILKYKNRNFPEKQTKNKRVRKEKKETPIAFTYKEKYELENIEEKILEQEQLVEELTLKIQEPSIVSNPEKMQFFCSELEKAQTRNEQLYKRWEFLEDKKQSSFQ